MIQTIDYKQSETSIKVGFKKYHFVVYGEIAVIEGFTKEQYLQVLYEQCKSSIDYETERYMENKPNSIVSDTVGEEFISEPSKINTLFLSVNKDVIQFEEGQESETIYLSTIVKDQYNDKIDIDIVLTTNFGSSFDGNKTLIIPKVDEYLEVLLTAKVEGLNSIKVIKVHPYIEPIISEQQPSEIEVLRAEKELLARSVYDLTSIVEMILIGGIE